MPPALPAASLHGGPLTIYIRDPHELKNGDDDEGVGRSICVHKLKHVNSALVGKRNHISGPGSRLFPLGRTANPSMPGRVRCKQGIKGSPLPSTVVTGTWSRTQAGGLAMLAEQALERLSQSTEQAQKSDLTSPS